MTNFDHLRVAFSGNDPAQLLEGMGGCLPRLSATGEWFPEWNGASDACPLVPRDQWASQESLQPYEWDDIDQNGYPACCLAATCCAIEFVLAVNGRSRTKLDWLGAWRALSGGRGGVALDTALQYAMGKGIALADGSGRVVVTEAWDCRGEDSYASGLQRGGIGVFGHDAHAECGVRLVFDSGRWYIDTRNSWGDAGRWHLFRLDRIEFNRYGGFLIREVDLRPIDTAGMLDAKG